MNASEKLHYFSWKWLCFGLVAAGLLHAGLVGGVQATAFDGKPTEAWVFSLWRFLMAGWDVVTPLSVVSVLGFSLVPCVFARGDTPVTLVMGACTGVVGFTFGGALGASINTFAAVILLVLGALLGFVLGIWVSRLLGDLLAALAHNIGLTLKQDS